MKAVVMQEVPDGYKRIAGYERYTGIGDNAFPEVIGVGKILRVWIEGGIVHAVRSDGENEVEWRAVGGTWERVPNVEVRGAALLQRPT